MGAVGSLVTLWAAVNGVHMLDIILTGAYAGRNTEVEIFPPRMSLTGAYAMARAVGCKAQN